MAPRGNSSLPTPLKDGVAYYNSGRFAQALNIFQNSLSGGRRAPEARCYLAHCLFSLGKTPEAAGEFERLVRDHPDYAPAYRGYAGLLNSAGRRSEARALLRKALRRLPPEALGPTGPVELLRVRAAQYNASGQWGKARRAWKKLIGLKPSDDEARRELAESLWRQARQGQKSGKLGEGRALALKKESFRLLAASLRRSGPRSPDARQSCLLHARLSELLEEIGDFPGAVAHARRALRLDPRRVETLEHQARLCLWIGRYGQAARLAARLLKLAPEREAGWRISGAALLLMGRPRQALGKIERALRLAPNEVEPAIWRAEALRRLGRWKGALEGIQQALYRCGNSLSARLNEALTLLETGQEVSHDYYAEIERLLPIGAAAPKAFAARLSRTDPEASASALRRMLAALKGNRSPTPTYLESAGASGLRRFASGSPRRSSRREAQLKRRVENLEKAWDEFGGLTR